MSWGVVLPEAEGEPVVVDGVDMSPVSASSSQESGGGAGWEGLGIVLRVGGEERLRVLREESRPGSFVSCW